MMKKNKTDVVPANTAYYVSSSLGSDSYDGLSETYSSGNHGPWKTLDKVSQQTFSPGERILFKCNDSWTSTSNVMLTLHGSGNLNNWIEISSYGTGDKPKFDGGDPNSLTKRIIYAQDVSYWKIINLEILDGYRGMEFYYTTIGNNGIDIEDCDIHGFSIITGHCDLEPYPPIWYGGAGIHIYSHMSASNVISDITIKNIFFENCASGVFIDQLDPNFNNELNHSEVHEANQNILIEDIYGQHGVWEAVCVACATNLTLNRVIAFNNGGYFNGGPANAALYFVTNATINDSEFAYNDRDDSPMDGDGLDLVDVINATINNCIFHHNDAIGSVYNGSASNMIYNNCVFYYNQVDDFYTLDDRPDAYGEIAAAGAEATFVNTRFYPKPGHVWASGDISHLSRIDTIVTDINNESLGTNLALSATASASSNNTQAANVIDGSRVTSWSAATRNKGEWLELDFGKNVDINKLVIEESTTSNINRYAILYWDNVDNGWHYAYNGMTIGSDNYYKILPFATRYTSKIRFQLWSTSEGVPNINEIKAYGPEGTAITDGWYKITSKYSPDYTLNISDQPWDGHADAFQVASQAWGGYDYQKWHIQRQPDGWYKITSGYYTHYVFNITDQLWNGQTDAFEIASQVWGNNDHQKWDFRNAGSGYYSINSKYYADRALTITDEPWNGHTDAVGFCAQVNGNHDTQHWTLTATTAP